MPRGFGRLNVQQVPVAQLERAARQPNNIRVGATNDPLGRARSYEQRGANGTFFVGQYLYTPAANTRMVEDHLLRIARQCGNAMLNIQGTSNYSTSPRGYVYVILGRVVVPPLQRAAPAARRIAASQAGSRRRGAPGAAAVGGRGRGRGPAPMGGRGRGRSGAPRRPSGLPRPAGVPRRQQGGGGGILNALARALFG